MISDDEQKKNRVKDARVSEEPNCINISFPPGVSSDLQACYRSDWCLWTCIFSEVMVPFKCEGLTHDLNL